jgi:hypothetical protein
MKHTDAEIGEAAGKFGEWADSLDPATITAENTEDLAAIAEAADAARRDEALIARRVADARARGRSWNRIAIALGVTRQAARQRFGGKVA